MDILDDAIAAIKSAKHITLYWPTEIGLRTGDYGEKDAKERSLHRVNYSFFEWRKLRKIAQQESRRLEHIAIRRLMEQPVKD